MYPYPFTLPRAFYSINDSFHYKVNYTCAFIQLTTLQPFFLIKDNMQRTDWFRDEKMIALTNWQCSCICCGHVYVHVHLFHCVVYWSYGCPRCGERTSAWASVRQEKAFWGIFSTSSRLFSKWTEAKVEPELRGWHTPHRLTCLQTRHTHS